jgi:hypothetical protein
VPHSTGKTIKDIPFSNLNKFCNLKRVDLDKFLGSHSGAVDVFFLVERCATSRKNGDFKPS